MSRGSRVAVFMHRAQRPPAAASPSRRAGSSTDSEKDGHAKPAYALAGLFVFYYLLGTVVANWQVALAGGLALGVLVWVGAALLSLLDVPLIDRWRLRRTRRLLRREIRAQLAAPDAG